MARVYLSARRTTALITKNRADEVRIVDFLPTRVATLEHRGDPSGLDDTVQKFILWRRQNGLPPAISATFNILYDKLPASDPDDFRFGLCAATDGEIAANELGVVERTIPGGKCAVLRHVGSEAGLGETIYCLYAQWLPDSGAELRDYPVFFQRVSFGPNVPANEAITDVFLPLK
ncbi:MAG: GyrI-like domain-containing protein [Proteobacteria bacterium]|nr:GyrI-like domain-containing protein [Pseudomonadota bacterium]